MVEFDGAQNFEDVTNAASASRRGEPGPGQRPHRGGASHSRASALIPAQVDDSAVSTPQHLRQPLARTPPRRSSACLWEPPSTTSRCGATTFSSISRPALRS